MSFLLRVRFASFFAGATAASIFGFYILKNDYKIAYQQMKDLHDSLEERITALEKLKEIEAPQHVEAAE